MVATKKKSVEKAVAGASQEVRVANVTQSVTERTAENAVVEASQIKTCRSRKVVENANTSVTTITVKTETAWAVTEEGTGDQGDGGEVCIECGRECVLKHETVHEVAIDRTCTREQGELRD